MPYCESFFSCVYYVLRCTVVSVTPFRPLLGRYSKGKNSLSITWRDEQKTIEAGDKRRILWLSAFLTLARVHSIWQYSVAYTGCWCTGFSQLSRLVHRSAKC